MLGKASCFKVPVYPPHVEKLLTMACCLQGRAALWKTTIKVGLVQHVAAHQVDMYFAIHPIGSSMLRNKWKAKQQAGSNAKHIRCDIFAPDGLTAKAADLRVVHFNTAYEPIAQCRHAADGQQADFVMTTWQHQQRRDVSSHVTHEMSTASKAALHVH